MRTALLFQSGNFVGREYFADLTAAGRAPDLVIAVGRMTSESIAREIERTGGLWAPLALPTELEVHSFGSLNDPKLWSLLKAREIDIAIQGGVGILKGDMLDAPRIGWLNVHPGKLPEYRGNACPEWAVLNGADVWATAHMVDAGIDSGPVVASARYDIAPDWTYHQFRANLYRHCADVLVIALARIEAAGPSGLEAILDVQDASQARYWPALDDDACARLKLFFPARRPDDSSAQAAVGGVG